MKSEEKIWGRTTELFHNNTTSTHYLEIKKGGYCSEHRHAQKSNIFYMIEGDLKITTWSRDDEDSMVLTPHSLHINFNNMVIRPKIWHKFHAITDVKCIEIYDYKYDGVDIERRAEGGLHET